MTEQPGPSEAVSFQAHIKPLFRDEADFQEVDAAGAEHEVGQLRQEWRFADEAVASG